MAVPPLPSQSVKKDHLCVDAEDAGDHEWIKTAEGGHEGYEFMQV